MSNYTIQVNWAGKDALPDSSPAKVISGDDFNTEFVAVRTALNSKADLNGDTAENFSCNDLTVSGENATVDGHTVAVLSAAQTFTKAHPTAGVDISMTADQTANLLDSDVFVVTINSSGWELGVSNQISGNKAKFIIKNTGAYTMSLSSSFYLPGGATYTATSGSGAVDVLDCVSDGTSMFCTLSQNY